MGRVPTEPGSREPDPQAVPAASGFDPSREQLDAWLEANCGRGVPFDKATNLQTALHGLSYILRQIESTNTYRPFIGQCGPATSSLRWALDHFALLALRDSDGSPEGGDACGSVHDSAGLQGIAETLPERKADHA